MFFKIDGLQNFSNFTTKHLCWSLFFNKVADQKASNFFENSLQHKCLSVKFAKFLRTPFLIEHLCWLPLPTITNWYNFLQLHLIVLANLWR